MFELKTQDHSFTPNNTWANGSLYSLTVLIFCNYLFNHTKFKNINLKYHHVTTTFAKTQKFYSQTAVLDYVDDILDVLPMK